MASATSTGTGSRRETLGNLSRLKEIKKKRARRPYPQRFHHSPTMHDSQTKAVQPDVVCTSTIAVICRMYVIERTGRAHVCEYRGLEAQYIRVGLP